MSIFMLPIFEGNCQQIGWRKRRRCRKIAAKRTWRCKKHKAPQVLLFQFDRSLGSCNANEKMFIFFREMQGKWFDEQFFLNLSFLYHCTSRLCLSENRWKGRTTAVERALAVAFRCITWSQHVYIYMYIIYIHSKTCILIYCIYIYVYVHINPVIYIDIRYTVHLHT